MVSETPNTLAALTRLSGTWLARSSGTAERHTTAVLADRFDLATWRDTYGRATALHELAADLEATHPGARDLLTDVFVAAYRPTGPQVRAAAAMDPTRLLHHRIVTALTESADFDELRSTSAGDPYAAALAVLALAPELRRILENTRREQDGADRAKEAQRNAEHAAAAVAAALREAVGQTDGAGAVPDRAADAVRQAVTAAEAAGATARQAGQSLDQALTAVAPGVRAATHTAAARAVAAARKEAALMRAWGVAPAETERMPFDQRLRLAQRLGTGRLARWADLIGRFRRMADGERARKVHRTTGELVGVTLGDDLSRIVPAELAHLGSPELRALFAARYAAGELMLYDNVGEQSTGRGAIVACVDTSHSMYEAGPGGVTREAWAKGCALALLDQARHARRDFVGILFSAPGKIQTFRFPAGEQVATGRVLEFAETFLGGGTSYESPLRAATEILDQELNDASRSRGDIVMITDDECDVGEEWLSDWRTAKHRLDFRLFAIAVGAPRAAEPESVLDLLSDNLRTVDDLTDVHAAADLFRVI
ncbi:VWA domain-containing protein [Streptomyces sp. NPDC004111]|uniref:VWA domain-containing protein n=1 Tax=Streptomyces sp. NPDC004111 TaxID=3364690 RepID=UPI00367E1C31